MKSQYARDKALGSVWDLRCVDPHSEIDPEYSLEGLMLKLKLQYFGHSSPCEESAPWKRPWCWKRLKQEQKNEDEMVGQLRLHYWLSGHEFKETPGDSEGQGSLGCCSLWGHKELGTTEWLNRQTETAERAAVVSFSGPQSPLCKMTELGCKSTGLSIYESLFFVLYDGYVASLDVISVYLWVLLLLSSRWSSGHFPS